jgi:hypothetical protein
MPLHAKINTGITVQAAEIIFVTYAESRSVRPIEREWCVFQGEERRSDFRRLFNGLPRSRRTENVDIS